MFTEDKHAGGVYTLEQHDAYVMAKNFQLGGTLVQHINRPGEYPHYHVYGQDFLGHYKHVHFWYGSIYVG